MTEGQPPIPKEAKVWVELKDTIQRINEALKKDLEMVRCQNPECERITSIEFDLILRDTTKLDIITGLAPKVRKPTRMCKLCMQELLKELEILKEKDSDY